MENTDNEDCISILRATGFIRLNALRLRMDFCFSYGKGHVQGRGMFKNLWYSC
jgi:hypothetical protein